MTLRLWKARSPARKICPVSLELRQQTTMLITIGACATSGGIQALRNWSDIEAFKRAVYPNPEYIQSLSTSTPISEHVSVDYETLGLSDR